MRKLLVWKSGLNGFSESRYDVCDLEDLRDLVRAIFRGRLTYLEARRACGRDETIDSRLRTSAEDFTHEDFLWLTAPPRDEVRGVRA